MKMEQTECSETSEHKIQTAGNYPEEIIQHTEKAKVCNQEFLWFITLGTQKDYYLSTLKRLACK